MKLVQRVVYVVALGLILAGCSTGNGKVSSELVPIAQITEIGELETISGETDKAYNVLTTDNQMVDTDIKIVPIDSKNIEKETKYGNVEIHFIDTGNSDSVLIKEGENAMLIDGGDNDDGDSIVKYLKSNNITKLDYLIATHPHADHIGGLDEVVRRIETERVYVANGDADTKTYLDFIGAVAEKGIDPSVPLGNTKYMLGNSWFEVFNINGGNDTNNQSLVISFNNGEDKILFMGDAEKDTESEIIGNLGDVDILKAGHHGSRSSSSQAFLDKVKPEYAMLMCSNGNKYGHPHIEVTSRLEDMNVEVHRSDECGNVVFISTGSGVKTECKIGSYLPGDKNSSKVENNDNNKSYEMSDTKKDITSIGTGVKGDVYWTPSGKSYHSSSGCSTLSRSKTILSGSLAESGKSDACDKCN